MQTIIGLATAALLAIFVMGTWNAPPTTNTIIGVVVLQPVNNSGTQGTVTLTADGPQNTFVHVQAQGLASLATANFGLFSPDCEALQLQLNPLEATASGNGSSLSQLIRLARTHWWFGLRQGKTLVACGDIIFSNNTPTVPPITTPDGGSIIPVQGSPTPIPSDGTPHPAGS